ncbi:trehalose-phosphatase [Rhizobium sp. RU36D]|uniref:trehalose-phosphatase n=1 Tax=Rhizobium sp. RU36D TaxID=1907415 RepID=UPI0015C4B844|nr:trehalose-phosphatase [Rhizobium sp. RU36D]
MFLDLDGTLLEIAQRPEDVEVPHALLDGLYRAHNTLAGAVAIISGRKLDDIDKLLSPLKLSAAGSHGLQQRIGDDFLEWLTPQHQAMAEQIAMRLQDFASGDHRLLLERKPGTVALHYRLAPGREKDCRDAILGAVCKNPLFQVMHGKMVFEARPAGMNKGGAIVSFMDRGPFHGRIPVFIGDDVTDEDGFRRVNLLGGISIKVGAGATLADYRVLTVVDAREIVFRIASGEPITTPALFVATKEKGR